MRQHTRTKQSCFRSAHHTEIERSHQAVTRGSVRVAYSVYNELAHSRDSTVRRAMVVHIRNLAVACDRGSEGCAIHAGMQCKSSALMQGRALNPTSEPRAPKMRTPHFFCTSTTSRISKSVSAHRDYNSGGPPNTNTNVLPVRRSQRPLQSSEHRLSDSHASKKSR